MEIVLQGQQRKTLTISGDVIKIEKQGFFTGKREKTIPIRSVTSVEVKKPGGFVGFIQFSIAGGMARDSSYTLSGGAFGAVADENSVIFQGRKNYEIALRIKAYVESWSARQQPPRSPPAPISTADEIRKLKVLLEEGALTEEEFAHQKKQLLGM
jgi:hypothetical protein